LKKLGQREKKNRMKGEKTLSSCEPCNYPEVYLPSFSMDAEEFPEIKDWNVGDEKEVVVKIRMTGYNENKTLDDKNNYCRGDFDIIGIDSKEVKSRNDNKDD
jgi:hypothetical protein